MKKGKVKRIIALALVMVLMGTSVELPAMAAESCEHHTEHTSECGYKEAKEDADCTHEHGDECYREVTKCVHNHDECCEYGEVVEGVECTHECSVENGCITVEENCIHVEHDGNCGYAKAEEGSPCAFSCNECVSEESNQEKEQTEEKQIEEQIEEQTGKEETAVCTCETDDPTFHATNCPAYVAPENPECFCIEKCAEDTLNVWCDVCGVQGVNACQGVTVNMEATYAESNRTGAFVVTGGTSGTDYSYADSVLTIKTDMSITIANINPSTATTDRIVVEKDKNANIIFDGVNIDVSGTAEACAFKIEDDSTGSIAVTLAEGTVNTLKSGENCAGLQKNGTAGNLEIKGNGKLIAIGGSFGAGIGGAFQKPGHNITISGGKVTATGGNGGAGIGGGGSWGFIDESDTSGKNITISGGEIKATGGGRGAGIGGGNNSAGTGITISGGEITATGGYRAAGIGGAENGVGTNITISGGKVKAASDFGAGIGGGYSRSGSSIIISGGVVIATGNSGGAGIGGGYNGLGTGITISGGVVTATGNGTGAGIGGGFGKDGSNIKITGGSVKVSSDSGNAIGGGKSNYGPVTPTLEDGTTPVYLCKIENPDSEAVSVNGVDYVPNHKEADSTDTTLYAYLPAVTLSDAYQVKVGNELSFYYYYSYVYVTDKLSKWVQVSSIESGDFTVTGGTSGTDYSYDGCVLTIKTQTPMTIANTNPDMATIDRIMIEEGINANITLNGVNIDVSEVEENNVFAFKIKDNSEGNVTVTLAEGSVNTLKSGRNYAGLQKSGGSGTLEIKGTGALIAIGGNGGAGIGGAHQEPGKNLIISDGVITAIGGSGGAGIGGGTSQEGYNIRIKGGSVKAIGTNANAIGGGYEKEAVTPTLDGTTPVYLLEIENPDSEAVSINDVEYSSNHMAADREDTKLYAYLPAVTAQNGHIVRVGEKRKLYYYDSVWNAVDIKERAEIVTTPAAITGLFYDGTAKELITEGTADGGEMHYRLGENGTYSKTIPTGTDAGNYTVYYKAAGSEYSDDSEEGFIEVSIAKADTSLGTNENQYSKTFGDPDFSLNVTSNNPEAGLCYEVTEGADVIEVSSDGEVTIRRAGNAIIAVSVPETVNYSSASQTINITVNKADNAPNMPDDTMNVLYSNATVGTIALPEGWAWQDANMELAEGTLTNTMAVYIGSDKENYVNVSVAISITRESHEHDYISRVTKQPTTTEEGVMTYTCNICHDFYTRAISKLQPSGGSSDNDNDNDDLSGGSSGSSTGAGTTTNNIPVKPAQPVQIPILTQPVQIPILTQPVQTPMPAQPVQIPILTQPVQTPMPAQPVQIPMPAQPVQTSDTQQITEPESPQPFIKNEDDKEGWDVITDVIEKIAEGNTVTIDMNGSTVVPGEVLYDIKGQDIIFVFDLGNGVSWCVNGMDITSDTISDIDFEVKVGGDAGNFIPAELHDTVSGDNPFVNISLAYEGEFGFKAVLNLNLKKENVGLFANLFYYNPQTNEMEFVCADEIAKDGTAELIFTHASEYVVVIDKAAFDMPASSKEGILPKIEVKAEADVSEPLEIASDDNGNRWWLALLIAVLAVAGIVGVIVYSKKHESEQENRSK